MRINLKLIHLVMVKWQRGMKNDFMYSKYCHVDIFDIVREKNIELSVEKNFLKIRATQL